MNLRPAAPLVSFALLLASLASSSVRAATVPGDEWEMTTKMSMEGMPMQMPARTQKVCLAKGRTWDGPPMDKQTEERCKTKDWSMSGNHATWKVTCEGGMSGTGETTFAPDGGSYTSTMKMTMDQGSMKMDISGKRTGKDCDAEEVKKTIERAQKQSDDAQKAVADAQATMCRDSAAAGSYMAFIGPTAQCKKPEDKAAFCAAMKSYKGFESLLGEGDKVMADVMSFCGAGKDGILKDLCGRAVAEKQYRFLASRCPVEAKPFAQTNCAGRKFTGAKPESIEGFCVIYAEKLLK